MKTNHVNTPIRGSGLMSLVDAYLRLAPAPGEGSSTVTISRVFEWRTDYGNGVQRLSSGAAGVTKASPKK